MGVTMTPPLPATKIVCTIGPSSASPGTIASLVSSGMSIARLNFSHGTHEDHAKAVARIRREAHRQNRFVAILQDLQGPKIRLGTFAAGKVTLVDGAPFTLTTDAVSGDASIASVSHKGFPSDVRAGDEVRINDGLVRLKVRSVSGRRVACTVLEGGEIGDRKGINLPGRDVSLPSMTRKDAADLAFGLALGVDYVALSFVRTASDVAGIKKRIRAAGKDTPVIAKLEKAQAVANLRSILDAADGILVARGDLGVETELSDLPLLQKRILREASRAGVVAITATQMLESMIHNPRPTRAEVSDVANAVLDGTDAVMLSGETASGDYPVEAAATMRKVALSAETERPASPADPTESLGIPGVVADAACRAAVKAGAARIVVFTRSGLTARIVSKFRPTTPVVAFTAYEASARRMALYRGVDPFVLPETETMRADRVVERAVVFLLEKRLAARGDRLLFVYGSVGGHCDKMRVVQI
ncbi:MAG TPA: pyruvate kinase [Candidatus Deferrimicrobiaceae bacterium]